MGVLRVLKRGCAKFAPFWMKKKYLRTPRKSVKRAKNPFLKGPNRTSKIFFVNFFFMGGVFGTHKRGCAKFAPFWMKKIKIGTPHVMKFLSKSKPKKSRSCVPLSMYALSM
jgi:hypothetical protein